ncbi:transposase, partial [Endozoicomonas atrinae]|uniref:transposase n=1 Tax=Endozoicomonas atrinae TaxID=1333660 RepID=UPI001EE77012
YPEDIRKAIYTTNAIESLNSVIRKAIKNRKIFRTDESVMKVIPIAFSKSLSCRQLCLGIITMHYLEQMSRRPQLPEGFNDV